MAKKEELVVTTIYLPSAVMEAVEGLVEKGIYTTRSEAIRGLLTKAVDEEMRLLGLLKPARDVAKGARAVTVTMKMPLGLRRIVDSEAKRMGMSRGELIRTAIMQYILRGVKK